MLRRYRKLGALIGVSAGLLAAPGLAAAASPAAFTTTSDGSAVNANHYTDKCDVYLNGGPVKAALGSGTYTFFVLAPGGQATPTGDKLLSSDSSGARTFTVSSSGLTYGGPHPTSTDTTDTTTQATLIDLCDPALADKGYADTPNPGGVYILAICDAANVTPSACKYDAFKVKEDGPDTPPDNPPGDDLTAIKSATGSFTRTFSWNVTKNVDKTSISTNENTATFNYSVTATKGAGVDSGWTVAGQVTVFNTNDEAVTGVIVTDAIDATDCTVTGGSMTIPASGQETYNYTCSLASGTAGTNTATVTWDPLSVNSPHDSATATAPFDFTGSPTLVNNCTTVTDTFGLHGTTGTTTTLGTTCVTHTYTYARTIAVPASGCVVYDNTARETASGTSDSEAVTVCRLNRDGLTIGFWQNKNGQKRIADNAAGLCTYLAAYSNVLTLPSPCNGTTLSGYVKNVITVANASGDGIAMFRAQLLATALSAYFSPALANTGIAVDPAIFGDDCMTVAELLAFGNANFATLASTKTTLLAVKTVYDDINNNRALTC